jgi:hypothetical protein
MAVNLIGSDIEIMRKYYEEALSMQGIPSKYQYPLLADSDTQGMPLIDSYSDMISTHIFFDGAPKARTYKRYGWVVENDENLPFLVMCSYYMENLQKDCLFHIGGHHANLPDRIFRVTELTCDLQAPDHMVCQVVPVYGNDSKNIVGRTDKEVAQTYNKSNTFLKPQKDYRGDHHNPIQDGGNTVRKDGIEIDALTIKKDG